MCGKERNIRYRKSDGRWEGRYIVSRDEFGKAKYRSVYGRTEEEVKEKLRKTKPEPAASKEMKHDAGFKTVDTAAEEWFAKIKQYRKVSTYEKYHYTYKCHIKPYLGSREAASVTFDECVSLIRQECYGKDGKKSLLDSMRNVLSQIMRHAGYPVNILNKDIGFCVSKNFRRNEQCVFMKKEWDRLRTVLCDDINGYNLGILVCMMTGMRLGEICALKTSDIDLKSSRISVVSTVQRLKSSKPGKETELVTGEPKTANSKRIIPISDDLMNLLRKYMTDGTYLVSGSKVTDPRTYQYYFERLLASLSIDGKTFHSLRHSFATNWVVDELELKSLSEVLGHSSVNTTQNLYVHPTLEQKRNQMNKYAKLMVR